MDSNHTPAYQHQLLSLRANLLAQIAARRGGTLSRADVAAELFWHAEDPRAQVLTDRGLEFALDERELRALTQIDATLERIQVGHYGLCVDFGADISPARLHASPKARVACSAKKNTNTSTSVLPTRSP